MSGIFLIVQEADGKYHEPENRVLATTKGGYPHITTAYTGRKASAERLVELAGSVFQNHALERVELTAPFLNEFRVGQEGKMRYDVLFRLDEQTVAKVDKMRQWLRDQGVDFWSMEPHITYAVCHSREEADAALARAQAIPDEAKHLVITGVTID